MAEKRPLCQYAGTIEELRLGDTTVGGASGGAGALGVAPEYITADKTLTATSSGYQIVDSANTAEYSLTLPDATTITEGAIMFIVQNDSAFALYLKADSGGILGIVAAGVTAAFSLEDNATTDGAWKRTFEYIPPSGGLSIIGDGVVFESASTLYISVTTLSSSQALVCYRDDGNNNRGTACILDIVGSTITPAIPVVFESGNTTGISVTTISSTQAIVCYRDAGNSSLGTACILDISGSTITPATPVVFNSATSESISVTTLSSTQAIVCYQDGGNSSYGTACILDISGSTITPATPVVFNSASTSSTSVTTLNGTQALVCYRDTGNNQFGTACILDISGSTITPTTPVVFESAATSITSVTTLSSSQAIVCYRDGGNSNFGTACILDISGSTITPGTPVVFNFAASTQISVTTLSSSRVLVCYQDGGNSSFGTACILDISGSTIAAGNQVVFNSADTQFNSVTTLSSTQAIVCYQDGNSTFGTSRTISKGI